MRYGTPKFFDCEECEHNAEGGCEVLPFGPPPGPSCAWFRRSGDAVDYVAEAERELLANVTTRRARELHATFSGGDTPLADLDLSDWQDMVERLGAAILPGDVRRAVRVIRDFGANGLEVTCGACGETIEVDEDSTSECPLCHRPMSSETKNRRTTDEQRDRNRSIEKEHRGGVEPTRPGGVVEAFVRDPGRGRRGELRDGGD